MLCIDGETVTKPANKSEMAVLGTSCDDDDKCISGYRGNVVANGRLEDDLDKDDQERHEHGQTEAAEIELPEERTSLHGDEILRLDDQNKATVNDSNSQLKPDVENELRYGQDRANENNIGTSDMDDDDTDHDEEQDEEEKGNVDEKQDDGKEDEVVLAKENKENDEEAEEKEKEGEEKGEEYREGEKDAASRNSFQFRTMNKSAAEADKTTPAKTATSSMETGVHVDGVEKYDFDNNNFIVEAPNHPATDKPNTIKTSARSNVVEENLFNQEEESEIADGSVLLPPENNELNNVIRHHTEHTGKQLHDLCKFFSSS